MRAVHIVEGIGLNVVRHAEARELLSAVLRMDRAVEIREHVDRTMRKRFPVEFEGMLATG